MRPKTSKSGKREVITFYPLIKRPRTPGPGRYNIKLDFIHNENKIPCSFKGKNKKKITHTPSPGRYETSIGMEKIMGQYPSYSFGREKKNTYCKRPRTPGVARYVIKYGFDSPRITGKKRGYTFSTKKSSKLLPKIKKMPSSMSYKPQHHKIMRKSPAFTIGKSKSCSSFFRGEKTPGPAAYKILSKFPRKIGFSFGKSIKRKKVKKVTPGPGQYFSNFFLGRKRRRYVNKRSKKKRSKSAKKYRSYINKNRRKNKSEEEYVYLPNIVGFKSLLL